MQMSSLPWSLHHSGKVRDVFSVDPHHFLLVATDRVSAFDKVLGMTIPQKGVYLTQLSLWWFRRLAHIIPHHLIEPQEQLLETLLADHPTYIPRSSFVKRLTPVPIEAIVRGYLNGSAWQAYQANGCVHGMVLPKGLSMGDLLPTPLFTPTTKAKIGDKDRPLTFKECQDCIGKDLAVKIRDTALTLYAEASQIARTADFLLLDTKFEFGLDMQKTLYLMDELLTPDASRFLPLSSLSSQLPQHFDKEYLRAYLKEHHKDQCPNPTLPPELIETLAERYCVLTDAFLKLPVPVR